MSIITVILILVIVGVLMWLINTYIPMAGAIKTLLNIFVLLVLILWLLSVFGLFSFGSLRF